MNIKSVNIGICIILLVVLTSRSISKPPAQTDDLQSDSTAGYLTLERIFSSDEFHFQILRFFQC